MNGRPADSPDTLVLVRARNSPKGSPRSSFPAGGRTLNASHAQLRRAPTGAETRTGTPGQASGPRVLGKVLPTKPDWSSHTGLPEGLLGSPTSGAWSPALRPPQGARGSFLKRGTLQLGPKRHCARGYLQNDSRNVEEP